MPLAQKGLKREASSSKKRQTKKPNIPSLVNPSTLTIPSEMNGIFILYIKLHSYELSKIIKISVRSSQMK